VDANPAAPLVQERLAAFIQTLAATPGIRGIVFRDTVTPGYERSADAHWETMEMGVGYTVPNRLAMLRQEHVDPIDLDVDMYGGTVAADLSLPEFDDDAALGDARRHWNGLRNDLNLAFMRRMYAAAQSPSPHAVWIAARRSNAMCRWYGLWSHPEDPLPQMPGPDMITMHGPDQNYPLMAHGQSSLALVSCDLAAIGSLWAFSESVKRLQTGWDGILLTGDRDAVIRVLKWLAPEKTAAQ
jgi:hypothetical protein